MADKTIGSLPQAASLTDNSSFVCEDNGEAKRVTGKQFKDFAKEGASPAVKAAESAADRAEAAVAKTPKIQNGTWWTFDAVTQSYVDTGVEAQGQPGVPGEKGDPGEPGQPGEKGDPFRYEDFTPEQLDDLERGAKAAQAAAETAAASAATSAGQASVSEQNAAGSASAAAESASSAANSASSASSSEVSAQASKTAAAESASSAANSASSASSSEINAMDAESNAHIQAVNAKNHATAAAKSASGAAQSAQEAAESASAASTSETNAKASEVSAQASKTAAAESASAAANSAASASASASAASESASAAAASATAAKASEESAKASETAVKASETAAAESASAAKASKDAAKASETTAAGSANSAQQSASAASESASAAAESASSIGEAERIVTEKASEASSSAANAAASAEAAEKSAEKAANIAGGNFATKTEAQGYADTAESNAKSYTDQQISAIPTPDVSGQIGEHNTNAESHNDIRELIIGLTNRLNTLADSDDTTLDQFSEVVAYIKNNKSLIDGITTSKVNVADIINNLTTNVSNKPLSAAQGVALKALIDAITVPAKVSELENDSGYLTSYTETDPTVPAWAKAESKPSYTAGEVGAYTKDQTNTLFQNYLPLSGGTLIGNLTGKYITGTWLQVTADNHLSTASTKIAVLDSSGWVYYRTIAELLADLGIPDATTIRATTSVYGTTKLSTSVTSTSKTLAATPYAVKTALDQAKSYTDSAIGSAIGASY